MLFHISANCAQDGHNSRCTNQIYAQLDEEIHAGQYEDDVLEGRSSCRPGIEGIDEEQQHSCTEQAGIGNRSNDSGNEYTEVFLSIGLPMEQRMFLVVCFILAALLKAQ